jgi:hypothetical protein
MHSPTSPKFPAGRLLGALLLGLGATAVVTRAESPVAVVATSVIAGNYESEGTVVQTDSGYKGPVSLRALLALDFDLAQGTFRHPAIPRIDIRQDSETLAIKSRRTDGSLEWSAEWKRNGGFEATSDGAKLLLRSKTNRDDLFMFTLSTVNAGGAIAVKIEKIEASKFGPVGREVGTFLFLRK